MDAILWAVMDPEEPDRRSCLRAIVAPGHKKQYVEETWDAVGKLCRSNLKPGVTIFFCVPLSASEHLPLKDVYVRYG